ncbi:flavodoxin [[Collinsella] massiliensis]|uniref:Flavodoxin n=1 Tax=[Collinsella] massiliensis TaxID=1232426 RepID=A0A1Y3XU55_9ACTN|nr:flavodoxin [[Collinsella] massiliensis]OUN88641.1 flavodoxin [[Collinsella] massiliensis]
MADSTTLVAYFSASGVTKRVAASIARAIGADLFEIEPAEPYTAADLNWNDRNSRSSLEDRDASMRPAVARAVEDMDAYDTVLVGFPIWWGHEPAVIDTFFEQYDFSGKTVVPFATSGGSGISGAERSLSSKYPSIAWRRGALLSGSDAADWARGVVA